MVRILLTTFPVNFMLSTIILMVALFLAFVTSQWIEYVLLYPLHFIANVHFFQYFEDVKAHYIHICLYCFPHFFNWYSFHFSYTFCFLALFLFLQWCIRRVLYILLIFTDLWGYILTLWNFVIFSRKSACFLFSTWTTRVSFF